MPCLSLGGRKQFQNPIRPPRAHVATNGFRGETAGGDFSGDLDARIFIGNDGSVDELHSNGIVRCVDCAAGIVIRRSER
jgi:hypothetical protein